MVRAAGGVGVTSVVLCIDQPAHYVAVCGGFLGTVMPHERREDTQGYAQYFTQAGFLDDAANYTFLTENATQQALVTEDTLNQFAFQTEQVEQSAAGFMAAACLMAAMTLVRSTVLNTLLMGNTTKVPAPYGRLDLYMRCTAYMAADSGSVNRRGMACVSMPANTFGEKCIVLEIAERRTVGMCAACMMF